jgi:hypothetical protein
MTTEERFLEIVAHNVAELESDEHMPTPEMRRLVEPIFESMQAKIAEAKRAAMLREAAAVRAAQSTRPSSAARLAELASWSRAQLVSWLERLYTLAEPLQVQVAHRDLAAVTDTDLRSRIVDLERLLPPGVASPHELQ